MVTIQSPPTLKKIIFLLTYLSWFGCVYAGKLNLSEYSLLIPLLVAMLIHFFVAHINLKFTFIIFGLSFAGFLFDSFALNRGWISIPDSPMKSIIPVWLLSLWLLFAVSLPLYLGWLKDKVFLTTALGFIFGPLSYKGGEGLNVLFFSSQIVLLYYAIFWALVFPISIILTGKAFSHRPIK